MAIGLFNQFEHFAWTKLFLHLTQCTDGRLEFIVLHHFQVIAVGHIEIYSIKISMEERNSVLPADLQEIHELCVVFLVTIENTLAINFISFAAFICIKHE